MANPAFACLLRTASRRSHDVDLANPDFAKATSWRRRDIVDDIRTIIQRQKEYIYIPDLSLQV